MFFQFAQRTVRDRLKKAESDMNAEAQSDAPRHHEDLLGSFIAARKNYSLMTEQRLTHLSATNVLAGANNR